MRVLMVEDDQDFLATMVEALTSEIPGIEVVTAQSRETAFELIGARSVDLVVCDLKIPTRDGALDGGIEHGLAVHGRCRELAPGTPVLILTAYGQVALDDIAPLLTAAPSESFVGDAKPYPMTDFVQKGQFAAFLGKVSSLAAQLAQLDDVEILADPPQLELASSTERTLRIMASRKRGRQLEVRRLGGGLSDAQVFRISVFDEHGMKTALAVGKVARLTVLEDEEARYAQYVPALLPPASFAPKLDEVRAGSGDIGGLFYTLAGEFDRSLFELMMADPAAAASIVASLRTFEHQWQEAAQRRTKNVGEIRRTFVADESLTSHRDRLEALGISRFEARSVSVNQCVQHRDLHGLNVLVGRDNRPLLIDYGEVGLACASHDPVSLELSLLFHPQGREVARDWPTVDTARRWANVDDFVEGCPVAAFVRACRSWAHEVSAGPREVCVQAYSNCLRQLRYPDTPEEIAFAIAGAAMEAFAGSA